MRTPMWALRALAAEMPGLEADELQRGARAAIVPHLKHGDRQRLLHDLDDLARPRGGPPPFSPELFNDLDAAAAYFRNLGIEVRRVKTS